MAIQFTIEAVEDALYDWAHAVLPTVPIIWYHQNAPRPTVPYMSFHLSTIDTVKQDFVDGSGNMTGNRDFVLLCQGIGKNSMDFCEQLKSSLSLPAVRAALRANGVVFVTRLVISCIAEVVDSRWEERNILDLKFRFAQRDTDTSGIIEHTNIKKTFMDPSINTITVEHINI